MEFIDTKYPRGQTRFGHTGWVAWIDDESRVVHCREGACMGPGERGSVRIRTNDGDHVLDVPHGRLQWNRVAALDSLAADLREEGERLIRQIQDRIVEANRKGQLELAEATRGMMLHLVAVEVAKASGGDTSAPGTYLAEGLKHIEQRSDE